MAKSIFKQLKQHLSESLNNYFEEQAFFIFGVSGGPDSMALLYLFHELKMDGLVVHVNYGKRGKESDKDQELVEQMAFAWGYECCSIRLNPDEAGDANFQDWARNQRYQFFRDLKMDVKADAIVTAHHQDDQVETILQKVFRGSSPTAWQGVREWDGELFRPLLPFDKKEILDFCEAKAIPFRIDKSNESSEFARNFIRNDLSKKMDALFPGWKKNVLTLTEQGKAFEASMDIITDRLLKKDAISLKKYTELPDVLKPAVWKTILDQSGQSERYSRGLLKELAEIEFLQPGKVIEAGNLIITRNRNDIHLQQKENADSISKFISKKQAKKGWSLNAFTKIKLKLTDISKPDIPLQVDADKLEWPLMLRNWESGDIFHPLGMDGHQKISDHLTNRKIPSHLKEKALVLCGSDSTIYAIIYPSLAVNGERGAVSEMAKYDSTSQTFLTINFT